MKGVDTTFLIHLLRKDPNATAKAVELDNEPLVFTTEANVYEIVSGIKPNENVDRILQDLGALLNKLVVLPLDRKASIKAGFIFSTLMKQGKTIDDIDCLTAGILLTNGCEKIVTRNTKHFERISGLIVEVY